MIAHQSVSHNSNWNQNNDNILKLIQRNSANTPGGFHRVTESGVIVSCVWQNRFLEIHGQTTEQAILAMKKLPFNSKKPWEGPGSYWGTFPLMASSQRKRRRDIAGGKDRKRYGTDTHRRHVSKQGGKPPLNDHDASSLWWKKHFWMECYLESIKGNCQ